MKKNKAKTDKLELDFNSVNPAVTERSRSVNPVNPVKKRESLKELSIKLRNEAYNQKEAKAGTTKFS